VSEELPNIQEGPDFFPIPLYMDIEFQVYIPFRIQAQLSEREVQTLQTFTEKFKISIHHTYDLPVTFVEPLNPSQESTPSDAVQIVREFLEQECKRSKSDYVQFEYLGPSPFHADCYIQPGKTQGDDEADWIFQARHLPQRDYDHMIFEFNPRIFAEAIEAGDAIMEEIMHELGFFYSIVQLGVVKIGDWIRIQDLVDELISIQRMKGIRGFLKRVFERSKLINEAFTSIAEFESEEFEYQGFIQTRYGSVCSGREGAYFQSYIDNQIQERISCPTKEVGQLISFFEGRRVKSVETLVLLGSAILGGAIGALLTILLSK